MKGTIIAFNQMKGWGFIRTEGTNDVFFHRTNSPDFFVDLGAKVEFDLAPGFKLGQPDQAINLRNAGGAA